MSKPIQWRFFEIISSNSLCLPPARMHYLCELTARFNLDIFRAGIAGSEKQNSLQFQLTVRGCKAFVHRHIKLNNKTYFLDSNCRIICRTEPTRFLYSSCSSGGRNYAVIFPNDFYSGFVRLTSGSKPDTTVFNGLYGVTCL